MENKSKKNENTFSALDFLITVEAKNNSLTKSEVAENIWKEKEAQQNVLEDVKFNPITGTFDAVIPGIKFNPLTGGFDVPESLIKDFKNVVINEPVEEKPKDDIDAVKSLGIKFNPLTGGFDVSAKLMKDLKNGIVNEVVEEKTKHEIQKIVVSDSYQSESNLDSKNNIEEDKHPKQIADISKNLNMSVLGNLVLDLLKNDNAPEFDKNEPPIVINNIKENNLPLDKPIFNPEKPLPNTNSKLESIFPKVNKPELPRLMPSLANPNSTEKNKNINVSTTIEYSDKEKNELKNHFKINEDTGVFLDITLNTTKKEEAINILNKHCKSKYSTTTIDNVLFYEDKGINLYLENNIVKELEFKGKFEGYTSKGLKLGDTIEQAIKIYGKPTIMTNKGAVWRNLKIFLDKNVINSIKIQK